jgi:hypothetical protein
VLYLDTCNELSLYTVGAPTCSTASLFLPSCDASVTLFPVVTVFLPFWQSNPHRPHIAVTVRACDNVLVQSGLCLMCVSVDCCKYSFVMLHELLLHGLKQLMLASHGFGISIIIMARDRQH